MGSDVKIFSRKEGKVLHEFYCSNCCGYITVKLNMDKNGAHCVVCPSCDHRHYRIIKDGVITEDRAPSSAEKYADEIHPMKSAYSKESWEMKLHKIQSSKPADPIPKSVEKIKQKRISSSGSGKKMVNPVARHEHPQARSFISDLWQRSAAKTINLCQKVVSVFNTEPKRKKITPLRKKTSSRKTQSKPKPKANKNISPTVESLRNEILMCKNEKEKYIKLQNFELAANWIDKQRLVELKLVKLRKKNGNTDPYK